MEPKIRLEIDPFVSLNPFLKINQFKKVQLKEPDIYHRFQQLIKNKDKHFLKYVQVILHQRLKEL